MPIKYGKIVPLFTQNFIHIYTNINQEKPVFALNKIIYELISQ
jgi:hypothetical protein